MRTRSLKTVNFYITISDDSHKLIKSGFTLNRKRIRILSYAIKDVPMYDAGRQALPNGRSFNCVQRAPVKTDARCLASACGSRTHPNGSAPFTPVLKTGRHTGVHPRPSIIYRPSLGMCASPSRMVSPTASKCSRSACAYFREVPSASRRPASVIPAEPAARAIARAAISALC